MKKIDASEIYLYPKKAYHKAHGKEFLIERKVVTSDIISGIDLSYWIYVKKPFLWWAPFCVICQGSSRVSVDTIIDAKNFIDNIYPLMGEVETYGGE